MTDNDLVDQICAKIDTLSETGAREVIRMVREHDRDRYAPSNRPRPDSSDLRDVIDKAGREQIIERAYVRLRDYAKGVRGQTVTEWGGIESWIIAETLNYLSARAGTKEDTQKLTPEPDPPGPLCMRCEK